MANTPALVKQRDLTSIVKAMQAAGVSDYQLECKPGTVVVSVGKSEAVNKKNDWDDV
jgi:hypothetical protein